MKLNLGCGAKRIDGFFGVDSIKTSATDLVFDLNTFPYPWADNSIDEILMDNVLEHLDDVIKIMEELHRILKPGARLRINVPYFKSNSAFTDPTHRHFFTENSFKYFTEENCLNFYTKSRFEIISKRFTNVSGGRDAKHFFRNLLPAKKILNYFLFNIFDEIQFELKCLK